MSRPTLLLVCAAACAAAVPLNLAFALVVGPLVGIIDVFAALLAAAAAWYSFSAWRLVR